MSKLLQYLLHLVESHNNHSYVICSARRSLYGQLRELVSCQVQTLVVQQPKAHEVDSLLGSDLVEKPVGSDDDEFVIMRVQVLAPELRLGDDDLILRPHRLDYSPHVVVTQLCLVQVLLAHLHSFLFVIQVPDATGQLQVAVHSFARDLPSSSEYSLVFVAIVSDPMFPS